MTRPEEMGFNIASGIPGVAVQCNRSAVEPCDPNCHKSPTEVSNLYPMSNANGAGQEDSVEAVNPRSFLARSGDTCTSIIKSMPQLRLHWYITRGNGVSTPLIPVDELPHGIRLCGAPCQISSSQTRNMQHIAHLPHPGIFFELEEGPLPSAALDRLDEANNRDVSKDGSPTTCQKKGYPDDSMAKHEWKPQPCEQSSELTNDPKKRSGQIASASQNMVGVLPFAVLH